MPELINFPMLSQRDRDVNADFDCVPTNIAAALEWLLNKPYSGGQVKDAVLGANYQGGTGAAEFVDYCATQGVILAAVGGDLVAALQESIAAGHPALITEPDPYLAGWNHVCVAYKFDDSSV